MILVVGVLIATPGFIVLVNAILHTVLGPTIQVPGTTQLDLGRGTYVVFEHVGSGQAYGPITISRGHGVTIDHSQLEVRDPEGVVLEVRDSEPNQTIDRGQEHYVSPVEFTTPRAGAYVLQFQTSTTTEVMVERPLGDLFRGRAPWVIDWVVGLLIVLFAVAVLIVGFVRNGRASRKVQVSPTSVATAPPSWFADPMGEHRLRYGWNAMDGPHRGLGPACFSASLDPSQGGSRMPDLND